MSGRSVTAGTRRGVCARPGFRELVVVAAVVGVARADYPLPPEVTGDLYVSSYGTNEVVCYAPDGELRFRFDHEDLEGPRGLAFAPSGELYAGAQTSDRVLVFTPAGEYLRQFTADGLDQPTSVAFAPDGALWVSSFGTGEIFVFRGDVFERPVGAEPLTTPNCIAFGPEGRAWVANQGPSRVVEFTLGGEFVRSWDTPGVSSLMGVAVFEGGLWVTGGGSSNVGIFTFDGEPGGVLSSAPIALPQGIAFDDAGRYTLASFADGSVATFEADGTWVRTFAAAGLRVARSVAFRPVSAGGEERFVRGDANDDGRVDLSDAVAILGALFLGAPLAGDGAAGCDDAADADDSGELQITDAIVVLGHLFLGAPPPAPPFPEAGVDPTADGLGCRTAG